MSPPCNLIAVILSEVRPLRRTAEAEGSAIAFLTTSMTRHRISTGRGYIEPKDPMPHPSLSPRQYLILGLVALCAPLGDSCLSRGMTALPSISVAHPGALIAAVFTPWIALGIALLIGFFASYLTALSWADLTFVLPATAFGNVIVALIARFWLHETISVERWAGIALITLGVSFVAQGPSRTEHPAPRVKAQGIPEPDPKEIRA